MKNYRRTDSLLSQSPATSIKWAAEQLHSKYANENGYFQDETLEEIYDALDQIQAEQNTTGLVVETFTDPTDGFAEITVSVNYHPGQAPMSIALSPSQACELISSLAVELARLEKGALTK
ncbi:hypothetical protein [Corynebacterium epidermidicanis]|uniref:Uncharacterized protein n=1 Tax=Corynebacterium epidermidicanis TaxID=1050174 RepID=A0A0G3GW31_9CORY|nr:hypothetical protein [Corynebacterium epidermidicanis]AKK03077.1 hypothetical protein CEPID_06080 [Corynebacterium epidermidicanis]